MAMRLRLQPLPETIQEFELAAEERYWTGMDWFVELRYRAAQATTTEINEVYEDVSLIRSYYRNGSLYTPRS